MKIHARISEGWRSGLLGAAICAVLGLMLWWFPRMGDGLALRSFDSAYRFRPEPARDAFTNTVIVFIDEVTLRHYDQSSIENWDRRLYAPVLDRLQTDGAALVVFDIFFGDQPNPGNDAFARAIRENGKVVLAGVQEMAGAPELLVNTVTPPPERLRAAAADWGLAVVRGDQRSAVRQYHPGNSQAASLPLAAARLAGVGPTNASSAELGAHWLNYYSGRSGRAIPTMDFQAVTNQLLGFFRDKFVFIGGRTVVDSLDESGRRQAGVDEYPTPFSPDNVLPGVEITATAFLNLARGDCLSRLAPAKEAFLVLGCGVFFGFFLTLVRPLPAALWALLGGVAVGLTSIVLVWETRVWWPWLWIASVQLPVAVGWSVLVQTRRLRQQKEVLEQVIQSSLTAREALPPIRADGAGPRADANVPATIAVPDHTLLRRIGRGAYGEVWLARNAIGLFRAVKIVRKNEFSREGPYEREFNGIRSFMPVTLQHPRLLHLLHVGRDDAAGYFYAIMEAADDETTGGSIQPESYSPRTLSSILARHGPLPPAECIGLVVALSDALEFLHARRLIHRDIKPANIIFVNGVAKLADIGLVTEIARTGQAVTMIGTAGYMAPEGPGTAVADIYSLGKVIYEALFGREPDLFPELPTGWDQTADPHVLREFNRIIGKACQTNPGRRFQSAAEIRAEMLALQR